MKNTGTKQRRTGLPKWGTLCLLFLFLLLPLLPSEALAQAVAPPATCTTDSQFAVPATGANGLITRIVSQISNIVNNVSATMFTSITSQDSFLGVARIVISLYIAVYGVLFTFGMVQVTLYDFAMRLIKISIVVFLLAPGSWLFFNDTVVTFFNDGTNHIIGMMTSIAVNGINPINPIVDPTNQYPFRTLDSAIAQAVSAKMAVTLLGTFFTGPYGIVYGMLMLMALGSFIRALLTALWVYLMSLVLKALLFGLAPIFLVCLLFGRTRHLFDGWLNQVVNASLQPILLFTFFAFFVTLIDQSLENILETPVCWTAANESLRGSPYHMHYWRFSVPRTATCNASDPTCFQQYTGTWSYTGADSAANAPIFPIDLVGVLIFLLLAELASRFNHIVLMIASDLAGASTSLASMQGALSEWFTTGAGSKSGALGGGARTLGVGGGLSAAPVTSRPKNYIGDLVDRIGGMSGGR